MRDVILVLLFSSAAIMTLRQPYYGILLWTWLSIMNPHRMTWGFSYSLPFAAIAAAVTLFAMTYGKPRPKFPVTAPTILLIAFILWTIITTVFAIHVELSFELFIRAFKTLFMTLIALAIIQEKKHIQALLWVVVGSIAFYGIKGGAFTIATGGSYRVWGPLDSLIYGNNELAVALVMTVPLLYFMSLQVTKTWQRMGFYISMLFCSAAALGSQSRGAFLAILAMLGALSWKSKHRLKITMALIAIVPFALAALPEIWWQRMATIQTYQEDGSAMGRIVAWKMAWNIAIDRITGAGFATATRLIYDLYSPLPGAEVRVAHSIYFQVLGDHGIIGLLIYLAMWFTTYRMAGNLRKLTENRPDIIWIRDLGRMLQVSLLGFFIGGAFLSLAYWDVPFYILVLVVTLDRLLKQEALPQKTQPIRESAKAQTLTQQRRKHA